MRVTHGSDAFGRGHHVCQSGAQDVVLQVLEHGLDAAGHLVHEGEHQVQLCPTREREGAAPPLRKGGTSTRHGSMLGLDDVCVLKVPFHAHL